MRVYKNKKKFIDPRYFMDEKLEEATDWPEDKTQDAMMGRASGLAQQGMEQAATGERPPWEGEDSAGDGFTDAELSEDDYEVLQWILKDLRIGVGRGDMAEKFIAVMQKLGIALESPDLSGFEDIPEEESEEDRYHRERHEDHKKRWK